MLSTGISQIGLQGKLMKKSLKKMNFVKIKKWNGQCQDIKGYNKFYDKKMKKEIFSRAVGNLKHTHKNEKQTNKKQNNYPPNNKTNTPKTTTTAIKKKWFVEKLEKKIILKEMGTHFLLYLITSVSKTMFLSF